MQSHYYYTITNSYFPNNMKETDKKTDNDTTQTYETFIFTAAPISTTISIPISHLIPTTLTSLTPHTHVPQETPSEQQSTALFCTTCCSAEQADRHSTKKHTPTCTTQPTCRIHHQPHQSTFLLIHHHKQQLLSITTTTLI